MRLIKESLIVCSLFQYISQSSFWSSSFYWFFLWIIAFQLLWFYIENSLYKKIVLAILGIFALINTIILMDFPLIMWTLLAMDLRTELSRKKAAMVFMSLLLVEGIIWAFLDNWPSISVLAAFLGLLTLAWWGVEQTLNIEERNKLQYESLSIQKELEEKTALLQSQMESRKEIYTLNERNRISRDLHDSVGHTLSTIVIQTAALEKLTEKTAPEASKMLNELHQFTKKGLSNVREVIHALKPSKYNRIAFYEQLNTLVKEFENSSNLQVYFNHNDMRWKLSEEQEQLLFRAIQEFLVNATKHSQASEVRIQLHFTDASLILTMQDNGIGTEKIDPQMGLTGMQERAKLLGGKVTIESAKEAGFKVRISLPKGGVKYVGSTD